MKAKHMLMFYQQMMAGVVLGSVDNINATTLQ